MHKIHDAKSSKRYQSSITELRAVFAKDERLYNFVCERLPSDAVKDIKREISGPLKRKRGRGYWQLMELMDQRARERRKPPAHSPSASPLEECCG